MIELYFGIAVLVYLAIGFAISLSLILHKNFNGIVSEIEFYHPLIYSKTFWIIIITLLWIVMLKGIKINRSKGKPSLNMNVKIEDDD